MALYARVDPAKKKKNRESGSDCASSPGSNPCSPIRESAMGKFNFLIIVVQWNLDFRIYCKRKICRFAIISSIWGIVAVLNDYQQELGDKKKKLLIGYVPYCKSSAFYQYPLPSEDDRVYDAPQKGSSLTLEAIPFLERATDPIHHHSFIK